MNCDGPTGHKTNCDCVIPEPMFYIQCTSNYAYDYILWWRPDSKGYTHNLADAGLYTREEANSIANSRSLEVAWPQEVVEATAERAVNITKLSKLTKPEFDGTGRWIPKNEYHEPDEKPGEEHSFTFDEDGRLDCGCDQYGCICYTR